MRIGRKSLVLIGLHTYKLWSASHAHCHSAFLKCDTCTHKVSAIDLCDWLDAHRSASMDMEGVSDGEEDDGKEDEEVPAVAAETDEEQYSRNRIRQYCVNAVH